MSIYDLMESVRNGEFQVEFQKCSSTEDKVNLFKKYGINISIDQYREIEAKVSAIKQGKSAVYNIFENENAKNRKYKNEILDGDLSAVSAGVGKYNKHENIVLETLKHIPFPLKANNQNNDDSDVKIADEKDHHGLDLFNHGLF